jgi:hypothetical protein
MSAIQRRGMALTYIWYELTLPRFTVVRYPFPLMVLSRNGEGHAVVSGTQLEYEGNRFFDPIFN